MAPASHLSCRRLLPGIWMIWRASYFAQKGYHMKRKINSPAVFSLHRAYRGSDGHFYKLGHRRASEGYYVIMMEMDPDDKLFTYCNAPIVDYPDRAKAEDALIEKGCVPDGKD